MSIDYGIFCHQSIFYINGALWTKKMKIFFLKPKRKKHKEMLIKERWVRIPCGKLQSSCIFSKPVLAWIAEVVSVCMRKRRQLSSIRIYAPLSLDFILFSFLIVFASWRWLKILFPCLLSWISRFLIGRINRVGKRNMKYFLTLPEVLRCANWADSLCAFVACSLISPKVDHW